MNIKNAILSRDARVEAPEGGGTNGNISFSEKDIAILEEGFIDLLVRSGQIDFNPASFKTPDIVETVQRAAGVDDEHIIKPPFKLRTGPETGEEISQTSRIMADFIAFKGIDVPRYIGGPARKATVLAAATAEELRKWGKDIDLVIEDKGGAKQDLKAALRERGIRTLKEAEMPRSLNVNRLHQFAEKIAHNIHNDTRFYDGVAGSEVGIAAATAILKTLFEERPPLDKKLVYGQNEPGAQPVRGDIKRGESVYLVRYGGSPSRFGLYGNMSDNGEILIMDDSVVSYRSLTRYMKKLKASNPGIKVRDIVVQIEIDELGWMRHDFDEYLDREWGNSSPRIHHITSSSSIIRYVHDKKMSVGRGPLVGDVRYQNATDYFDRMKLLGTAHVSYAN